MISNKGVAVENKGTNSGLMVGVNNGTIINKLATSKKLPSLIMDIVRALSTVCTEFEPDEIIPEIKAFKPDDKINHNCVIKYKEIIEMYSTYYTPCDNIMNIFDDNNSGSKKRMLFCVHNWYLQSKGELLRSLRDSTETDLQKIQRNSDFLIDSVMEKIEEEISNSVNFTDVTCEEVSIGVMCFTCYCFMECKVLEKP